jgi:hypothetical protein
MNKNLKPLAILGFASVVLTGCTLPGQTAKPTATPAVNTQSINKSLEGTVVSQVGGEGTDFTFQTATGPVAIHEGNATLSPYIGKKVRVTGQYSGTTLYVDSVELIQ